MSYVGPIPPPDMLAQYNGVVPGAAERILKMAEEQSAHRQYLEKTVVNSDIVQSRLGVICAFIVSLAFLFGAVWVALSGHPWLGGFLGTVDLVSLVSVFVYGAKSRREEREANYRRSKEPLKNPSA
ncbi:MAG: DUF2335 domain-containing protein [Candidatus Omnitrophota bacterium]|jgi:uncharacterized membrane protein